MTNRKRRIDNFIEGRPRRFGLTINNIGGANKHSLTHSIIQSVFVCKWYKIFLFVANLK
jgi:hypothetical protein